MVESTPWARADLLPIEAAAIRDRARRLGVDVYLSARGPYGPFSAKAGDVLIGGASSAYAAGMSALGRLER